jgi:hypothetical protein
MADTISNADLEPELKAILEVVLKLRPENQAEILRFLKEYVTEQNSPSLLTDEQAAEVRRRLAEPNPVYTDQEDVFAEMDAMLREK